MGPVHLRTQGTIKPSDFGSMCNAGKACALVSSWGEARALSRHAGLEGGEGEGDGRAHGVQDRENEDDKRKQCEDECEDER